MYECAFVNIVHRSIGIGRFESISVSSNRDD